MADKERVEDILARHLTEKIGCAPIREYKFHPTRKWSIDVSYPKAKLAIEIHGHRGHSTAKAMRNDFEKANALCEAGWELLTYPADKVRSKKRRDRIVDQIDRVLCGVDIPEESAIVLTGDLT